MIGIYKITNKKNGKVYIGQSQNIEERWRSHKINYKNPKAKEYESKKYRAMRKYGINNFDFSVIEECNISELDEKEKYWIKQYNSVIDGYNISWGGQDSFGLKKEYHSQAKLSRKQIEEIYQLLIENEISYTEISKRMNISKAELSNINLGKNWYEEKLSYPLRITSYARKGQQNGTSKLTEIQVMTIREFYVNNSIKETILKFTKDFNISSSTVRRICNGESWKHLPYYNKIINQWIKNN